MKWTQTLLSDPLEALPSTHGGLLLRAGSPCLVGERGVSLMAKAQHWTLEEVSVPRPGEEGENPFRHDPDAHAPLRFSAGDGGVHDRLPVEGDSLSWVVVDGAFDGLSDKAVRVALGQLHDFLEPNGLLLLLARNGNHPRSVVRAVVDSSGGEAGRVLRTFSEHRRLFETNRFGVRPPGFYCGGLPFRLARTLRPSVIGSLLVVVAEPL